MRKKNSFDPFWSSSKHFYVSKETLIALTNTQITESSFHNSSESIQKKILLSKFVLCRRAVPLGGGVFIHLKKWHQRFFCRNGEKAKYDLG